MRFQIQIEGCDDRFSCSEEQTVLRSTEIGIKRRIPVGARVMSRAHVTREDQDQVYESPRLWFVGARAGW